MIYDGLDGSSRMYVWVRLCCVPWWWSILCDAPSIIPWLEFRYCKSEAGNVCPWRTESSVIPRKRWSSQWTGIGCTSFHLAAVHLHSHSHVSSIGTQRVLEDIQRQIFQLSWTLLLHILLLEDLHCEWKLNLVTCVILHQLMIVCCFLSQSTINIVFDRVGKLDPVTRGIEIAVNWLGIQFDVRAFRHYVMLLLSLTLLISHDFCLPYLGHVLVTTYFLLVGRNHHCDLHSRTTHHSHQSKTRHKESISTHFQSFFIIHMTYLVAVFLRHCQQ